MAPDVKVFLIYWVVFIVLIGLLTHPWTDWENRWEDWVHAGGQFVIATIAAGFTYLWYVLN